MGGCGRQWHNTAHGRNETKTPAKNSDVRSLLIDLRAHGASAGREGLRPPHTVAAAGADVVRTLRAALGGAPHVLAGLSLGGKVALDALARMGRDAAAAHAAAAAAGNGGGSSGGSGQGHHHHHHQHQQAADAGSSSSSSPPHRALPLHCWVLDSQPGAVPDEADAPTSVARILDFISRARMPVASRAALTAALDAEGLPKAVAWWLASGLVPAAPGDPASPLRWGFDAAGAAQLYASYRAASYWAALEAPPPGVTLHVVRGDRSDRWTPEMLARLEAARAAWQAAEVHDASTVGRLRLHVLPDAGHWLQADNPLGLQAMMLPSLRDEPGV